MSEDKLTKFLEKSGLMGKKLEISKTKPFQNKLKQNQQKIGFKKLKSFNKSAKSQNPAKKSFFNKKKVNLPSNGISKQITKKPLKFSKNMGDIRVVPLGGMEQVGGNMMFVEWGNDIIVIDTGLNFPSPEHLGIDVIIPNIEYLVKNKAKIRGILYTHGHLDHIGAAKYMIKDLGYPQMFATKLTKELILAGAENEELVKNYKLREIDRNSKIKLGKFEVEFFHINHSIPEGLGVCVNTPYGSIVHTGDFKFDLNPHDDEPADLARIIEIGKKGVAVAMVDSTGALTAGHTMSETIIEEELRKIITNTKGRLVITTFASNVGRVAKLIEVAEKCGRTVFLGGRSMERNTAIAKKLGYLKCKESTLKLLSRSKKVNSLNPSKVMILSTGSQGEQFAALTRMAAGMHKDIKLNSEDTIVFSTSPIPGNELAIVSVLNNLAEIGVKMINNKQLDTHVSGHGHIEELKLMTSLLQPKNIAPIHGEVYMRYHHRDRMIKDLNIPLENSFIMKNGKGVILSKKGVRLMNEKEVVPAGNIFVELGEVIGDHIMEDRTLLADSGVILIAIKADKGRVKIVKVNSRGFRYMGMKHEIFDKLEIESKKIYERHFTPEKSTANLENMLKQAAEKMIWQKFKKNTMVEVLVV